MRQAPDQSLASPVTFTRSTRAAPGGQNASSDTPIYRKPAPAIRLGGLAPLANELLGYSEFGVNRYGHTNVFCIYTHLHIVKLVFTLC